MKYAYYALDHRKYVRIDSIYLFQTISLRGFATTTSRCYNWKFPNSTFYPLSTWQEMQIAVKPLQQEGVANLTEDSQNAATVVEAKTQQQRI
jgi:hypothetical protein